MSDGSLKEVVIHTDGAAEPNPGAGGYGVVLRYGKRYKELSGGYRLTTNNRMELLAAVVALEALKGRCSVKLHSDSQYIVDSVEKRWVFRWRDKGWKRTGKHKAKNVDLWQRFLAAYEKHEVRLIWVKGHAGIPDNERCDQLAVDAAKASGLPDDRGYPEAGDDPVPPRTDRAQSTSKAKKPGDPCRHCGTPLVRRAPKKRRAPKEYYYEWYLHCNGCGRNYMVEEGKRYT